MEKTFAFNGEIKKLPDIDGAYIATPFDIKERFGKGHLKLHARLKLLKNKNMTEIDVNKLHTTELGKERIKRNIGLKIDEVIAWCKQTELNNIKRKGKNWYVYAEDFVLTINVKSHTIITAHKRKSEYFL